MKTKTTFAVLSVLFSVAIFAQGKASVYAANSDISDNLDLRAVASIFGDSRDLSDFEYRLNDPNNQISNLDLNNDNEVDYLRVIELVENNTHLVVLQSVLQEDVYQDVASIVVSKKKNRQINIQVIGDPYMYGANYIYEPVYVVTPILYSNFWVRNYQPYRSYYGWNRYPTFYRAWSPYSYNHYHQNVYVHINHNNYYNYSTTIYNSNANNYYRKYRSNGYEQKYPHRNFERRTSQVNRYDYDRAQQNRSPEVAKGLRPSTIQSQNRTTSTFAKNASATARPTSSNTVRSNSNAASTVRPTSSNTFRSDSNTAATVRPTSSNTVRSNSNTAATMRPSTTANSAPRLSTTSSNNGQMNNVQTSSQRSSNLSQRSSSVNQAPQQRSSSNSARIPQQDSGSRTSSTSRSSR